MNNSSQPNGKHVTAVPYAKCNFMHAICLAMVGTIGRHLTAVPLTKCVYPRGGSNP